MASELQVPNSCRTIARHMPRQVTPNDPNELLGCPTLSNNCPKVGRTSAQGAEILADVGDLLAKLWPSSANFGRALAKIGQVRQHIGRN